jgi:hypothetical protein
MERRGLVSTPPPSPLRSIAVCDTPTPLARNPLARIAGCAGQGRSMAMVKTSPSLPS